MSRTRSDLALSADGRRFDAALLLEAELDRVEERCRRNGWERALAKLPAERDWLAKHRHLV